MKNWHVFFCIYRGLNREPSVYEAATHPTGPSDTMCVYRWCGIAWIEGFCTLSVRFLYVFSRCIITSKSQVWYVYVLCTISVDIWLLINCNHLFYIRQFINIYERRVEWLCGEEMVKLLCRICYNKMLFIFIAWTLFCCFLLQISSV